MKELYEKIEALSQKITETWVLLDLDSAKNEMKSLDFEMAESDFWSNPTKAKTKSQRREEIQDELTRWQQIKQDVEDLLAVTKDAEKEKDVSLKSDIESQLVKLEKNFSSLEFYILLDVDLVVLFDLMLQVELYLLH